LNLVDPPAGICYGAANGTLFRQADPSGRRSRSWANQQIWYWARGVTRADDPPLREPFPRGARQAGVEPKPFRDPGSIHVKRGSIRRATTARAADLTSSGGDFSLHA